MAQSQYVTEEMVRDHLADHAGEFGCTFSAEQIDAALEYAARRYNSVPPIMCAVTPDQLPATTTVFLDGAAAHLCRVRLRMLASQDITFSAGGVNTNTVAKEIEHYKRLEAMYMSDFLEQAKTIKVTRAIRSVGGKIG